jgi:hypothetical protein
MGGKYNELKPVNKQLAFLVLVFHASLVIFLLSLAVAAFSFSLSSILGILAFVLLLAFIIAALLKGDLIIEGVKISPLASVWKMRDHSVIIATIFLLFTLYFGMNRLGIVPGIYSDEYPRAYFDMINNSSNAKKKAEEGGYTYEVFMEKYKTFIKRQAERAKNSN